MPENSFKTAVAEIGGGFLNYWTDGQLKKIGARFKTSMSAVAIHLENVGLAPDGFFRVKLSEWRDGIIARKSPAWFPITKKWPIGLAIGISL